MPLTNRFLRLSRPRVSRATFGGLTRREALWPIALLPLAVSACGGGGDDVQTADAAPTPNGHWTVDDMRFVGAPGLPQEVGLDADGVLTLTAIIGDHDDVSHGPYSGSIVTVLLRRDQPGTYRLTPSSQVFLDAPSSADVAFLEVMVGSNVASGSTLYASTDGKLVVTRDQASGRLRFSTDGPVKIAKRAEVLGGVRGAPEAMTLQLYEAH